jgi:arabinofuranosyltransferase
MSVSPATTHQLPLESMRRSSVLRECLNLLVILIPAIFVATVNLRLAYDDAFITYRYAYNLARGDGFVYNIGEWFMGTTAPFYGLLLGVLGFMFGSDAIPLISGVVSGGALVMAGVGLYLYGRIHQQAFCGLLVGLFFVSNRLLPLTFGGEMLFQAALIIWGFTLYRMGSSLLAALLLALAILTRMDSVLAVGVIGLHYLLSRRRFPWRELLVVGLTLLPFALLSWAYYGSFLPATLDAKLAQRDSGLWPSFLRGLFEWIKAFTIQGSSVLFPTLPAAPSAIRFIVFVALGMLALALFRFWLLPLAWIALYVLAYAILNVPFYHWYVVPVALGLMILAGCGVSGAVELIVYGYRRCRGAGGVGWATNVLNVLCVLALAPGLYAQLAQTQAQAGANPAELLYEKTGHWLAANTAHDASVGYFEIGRIGYYADRRMIDPLGLIDPAIAPSVARNDLTWAYRTYQPDYILYNQQFSGWFGAMLEEPWFRQNYQRKAEIEQPGYLSIIVYQRENRSIGAADILR